MVKIKADIQLKLRWRYFLAVIAATLYFLGIVGFNQWYLSWFCLVPLFIALDGSSIKQSLLLGWLFGTIAILGCFYWLTYTIHVFAFMPWAVAAFGCLLLCIAQATQFALFGLLYSWLRKKTGLSTLLLGTIVYVFAEFISPQLFPHYFANSQYMNIPLIQICDITGILGITALLVFVNICIYLIVKDLLQEKRFRWTLATAAITAVLIFLTYGYLKLPSIKAEMAKSPKLRFGIAQVNLGLREKSSSPLRSIKLHQEQTLQLKAMGADIVVWPETAILRPVLKIGQKKLPKIMFDDLDIPVLIGAIESESGKLRPPIYNVAALSDKDGDILGIYKKQKLLMLGEYIPLGETFPILYKWMPFISHLTKGTSNEPLKFRDYLFGINICYEGILPRLIRRLVSHSPNVLVNLTNDNWFGRTHEPIEHLVLAAFRSVEHRLWTVRSTNTGISAFVDATGNIVDRSPLMEPAILIRDVPMMKSRTFYGKTGDWLGWLSIISVVGLALFGAIRKKVKT
jgi:apolipoprotein N-acyltransferase